LYPNGFPQPSCAHFPGLQPALIQGLGVHRALPDRWRPRWAPLAWSHSYSTNTDWLRGACLAMRTRDFVTLGGFSEATFMYGEDLELAYRVRRAGLRVRFCYEAEVIHHDDHSGSQRWSASERAARVMRAELIFIRQTRGRVAFRALRALLRLVYASRVTVLQIGKRHDRAEIYRAMVAELDA
jgi:GT2 family glycosyltransferase